MVKKLYFLIFLVFILSCSKKENKSNSFIGTWMLEEPIGSWEYLESVDSFRLETDPLYFPGKKYYDYTKSYWEVHDALAYTFNSDGTLIISGGPEPIEAINCSYLIEKSKLGTDSVLYITCPEYPERFSAKFDILSNKMDTIWLCKFNQDENLLTDNYCFLVKSKN